MSINLNDIVLTNSPFYLTYSKAASTFDYVILKLNKTLPNGSNNVVDNPDAMVLTAYKVNQTDDFVNIEISDYIKRYLNPLPDFTFFTSVSPKISNEIIYWTYRFEAYKIGFTDPIDVVNGFNCGATLGYGYYSQGVNPKLPSAVLIDNQKRFSNAKFRTFNIEIDLNNTISDGGIVRTLTSDYMPVCTGKYKGKQVLFLNRFGVYDSFIFPKAHSRSLKSRAENYYKNQNSAGFSPISQNKMELNKNASVEWSLNTDLLDDYNVKIIEELIVSDRYLLVDYDKESFIPLLLKTSDFEQKTRINDKAKRNYTLIFEEATDYKNNVKI